MTGGEIVVAVVIAIGLVGIVIPLMPGSVLIAAAVLVWAVTMADVRSWTVAAAVVVTLALGAALKYAVPGRRLQESGVGRSTLLVGAVLAVVGFFVVPVVGLPLGFVAGVYIAERRHGSHARAWIATRHAVAAIGLGVLIELVFGLAAAIWWSLAVVLS